MQFVARSALNTHWTKIILTASFWHPSRRDRPEDPVVLNLCKVTPRKLSRIPDHKFWRTLRKSQELWPNPSWHTKRSNKGLAQKLVSPIPSNTRSKLRRRPQVRWPTSSRKCTPQETSRHHPRSSRIPLCKLSSSLVTNCRSAIRWWKTHWQGKAQDRGKLFNDKIYPFN